MKGDISPLTVRQAQRQTRTLASDLRKLRELALDRLMAISFDGKPEEPTLLRTWLWALLGPVLAGALIGLWICTCVLAAVGR